MRRINKVCMIGMLACMVALTGCGKEEVAYSEETDTEEQGNIVSESSSTLLRDSLGIGDETVWKEDIEGVNGTIKVHTTFDIPDTDNLYTLEVEKYYVTAEDKKRIVEYFADADTIKVDTESVPTKESIQEDIESNDEYLALITQNGESEDVQRHAIYQYEQDRLRELLKDARNTDEISEEPGDYSEDFYTGSKNGVDYTFSFYADESRNRSAWRVKGNSEEDWYMNNMNMNQSNQCSMTKEEAEQKAVKLCEELGLPSMTPVKTYDLEWHHEADVNESEDDDENGDMTGNDVNGYVVELARSINGVPADSYVYFEYEKYVDGETTFLPYSIEQVEVSLSDEGIWEVFYRGILSKGETGESVKLLSFEQMKEICRKELEKEDALSGGECQELTLTYMRVADESSPNTFRYIPVWRLDSYYQSDFMQELINGHMWFNAMDGSRIDIEEVGSAYYMNAQGMGDYE